MYIPSETQFRRCLDQNLGFRLSDPDYQSLASKYELPSTGGGDSEVNYRQFCEAMESCEHVETHSVCWSP